MSKEWDAELERIGFTKRKPTHQEILAFRYLYGRELEAVHERKYSTLIPLSVYPRSKA